MSGGETVRLKAHPARIAAYDTSAAALHEAGITPVAVFGQNPPDNPWRTLARRSTIPVEVALAPMEGRLPAEVEVAASFVASEALAKTAKHASTCRIDVSLAPSDGGVRLEVRDDGGRGADPRGGSGLVGLVDRVEALGGVLRVRSPEGEGTLITAEFPLAQKDAVASD
jgi:nitrate/nitrite-specific signal transduction histidine kinase